MSFDESMVNLTNQCRPLQVNVSTRIINDRYYIVFDCSDSINSVDDWNDIWGGFKGYVKGLLREHKFSIREIQDSSGDLHIIVYVGTLFDFLSR